MCNRTPNAVRLSEKDRDMYVYMEKRTLIHTRYTAAKPPPRFVCVYYYTCVFCGGSKPTIK